MNAQTPEPATLHSRAEIPTANASRYLQQLCKHFAHKIPVTFDPHAGEITFEMGRCRLRADEAVLALDCHAGTAEQLSRLEDVVVRHLVRFAFREELPVTWSPQ